MNINQRLKEAINSQNMTIKAFSELVDIPYRSLQNYLREERDPNVDALSKICGKANVNLNWLLTGKGDMFVSKIENAALTSYEVDLIENFRKCDDKSQAAIMSALAILSKE
ncbi:helix-turn-helix domain-containing protein [Conservatibacter flavescens]|uniref:helix-turn-helix domain-containing protein n=1 Tax=Conservatibacter flavescens TaxID=28161 RepID=UPI0013FDCF8E|nr:helix-turn-helix transcriptional regulator [Conservatibacter flavescens]